MAYFKAENESDYLNKTSQIINKNLKIGKKKKKLLFFYC